MDAKLDPGASVCAACGETVAPGSSLFSDRRVIHGEGEDQYLCAPCQETIHGRHGRQLNEAELRRLIDTGAAVAMAWRE